ncbi:MAG: tRNA (adenine(22)-N(1))-methyltransferase TrmK [Candidatus Izemoplasmatales bacterium]
MKLSKRLEKALEYTAGFQCLRDVGCDHAYFPIEAVSRGYVKKSIASDNKVSPYESALKNVEEASLTNQIQVALLNGLDELTPHQDLVSILGMGGILISEILSGVDLKDVKRLILSPNSDASVLREFLEKNGWKVISEEFIKDHQKYYQIIVSEKGEMHLSTLEKRFGKINLQRKNKDFVEYIHKQIEKFELALSKVSEEKKSVIEDEIHTLKECL